MTERQQLVAASDAAALDERLRLAGGGALAIGALLWSWPLMPALLGLPRPPSMGLIGAALMVLGAALLARAIVGRRAAFGWEKLGGIALIGYCCWWLVVHVAPAGLLLLSTAAAGEALTAVRVVLGLIAAVAIAKSWPVGGYARWGMLVVVTCDALNSYAWGHVLAAVPDAALTHLLGALLPLSLVALGASHVAAAVRAHRER